MYLSEPVIKRLPMYYRYLKKLEIEGTVFVSSTALSALMGLTASQVRQDINAFGGIGRQGSGYPVQEMRQYIGELMGVNKRQTMIIVGMGHLGSAIAAYEPFGQNNFWTVAIFDNDPAKAGKSIGQLIIQSTDLLESFLQEQKVDIAALTLPSASAQDMGDRLYSCGIRGFWNFAPIDLQLPPDAAIINVHLEAGLEQLSYRMAHPEMW